MPPTTPETYLASGADYVLIGEGEETLGELLDRLAGRVDGPSKRSGDLPTSTSERGSSHAARAPTSKIWTPCPSRPGTWSTCHATARSGSAATATTR